MATKTITLTDEAYQRLEARRRDGESFSDVVLRLAGEDEAMADGAGATTEDREFAETVLETREQLDDDLQERDEELAEDGLSG